LQRKTKTIIGAVVLAVILFFGLSQFYQTTQASTWNEERNAVNTVYHKTILVKSTKVDTFVGDHPYEIVYGQDVLGQQLIVWLGDTEIHTEYASDGYSEKDLRIKFAAKEPTAALLRVMPGKLKDTFVWEVFYKKTDAHGKQNYYYDYLNFKDGSLIDTYNLGPK
jgi:uncharacterized protein YpmB